MQETAERSGQSLLRPKRHGARDRRRQRPFAARADPLVPTVLAVLLLLAAPCVGAFSATAQAADRVALVISMSAYRTINPLRNTPADAALIARTLEGLGFETETLNDANLAQLKTAMKDFAFRAETASIALVYYAGHGVEVAARTISCRLMSPSRPPPSCRSRPSR